MQIWFWLRDHHLHFMINCQDSCQQDSLTWQISGAQLRARYEQLQQSDNESEEAKSAENSATLG